MAAATTLALVAFLSAQAAIRAEPHKDESPSGLAAPVRAALAAGGVRAHVGSAQLDFWFVKALPLKNGGAGWGGVEEGTLVGAVQLGSEFRDVRGRLIKPGVYTLRFALQPQNGDHLGVSPFREYLLLIPASIDADVAPRGHEGTVELSIKTAGGSHPAIWSIDPPTAGGAPLSTHTTDLGHTAVIVEVPTARAPVRFGIVLSGRIDA